MIYVIRVDDSLYTISALMDHASNFKRPDVLSTRSLRNLRISRTISSSTGAWLYIVKHTLIISKLPGYSQSKIMVNYFTDFAPANNPLNIWNALLTFKIISLLYRNYALSWIPWTSCISKSKCAIFAWNTDS